MLYCFNDYQCQDAECVNQNCESVVINCFGYQAFESDAQNMQNANQSYNEQSNQNGENDQGLTCLQLHTCVTECNYDQNCISDCGNQASVEALSRLNAVYACINSSNCTTDECVENICASEVDQCF
jgi:hypothetical protein